MLKSVMTLSRDKKNYSKSNLTSLICTVSFTIQLLGALCQRGIWSRADSGDGWIFP